MLEAPSEASRHDAPDQLEWSGALFTIRVFIVHYMDFIFILLHYIA